MNGECGNLDVAIFQPGTSFAWSSQRRTARVKSSHGHLSIDPGTWTREKDTYNDDSVRSLAFCRSSMSVTATLSGILTVEGNEGRTLSDGLEHFTNQLSTFYKVSARDIRKTNKM